ncbi:MAG TPA: hypothetical protein VLW06_13525, partial [Terriglobales bacterium]|nr:hypothetical protein [Terriglobales bacterium]
KTVVMMPAPEKGIHNPREHLSTSTGNARIRAWGPEVASSYLDSAFQERVRSKYLEDLPSA